MHLLITIGLDDHLATRVPEVVDARVVSYPVVPQCWALDGKVFVESARVAGRWLQPDGVVFYSYFENADLARRAIALSSTPSYPDVSKTLPHDDQIVSLLLASQADGGSVARGFAGPGRQVTFEGERVFKWSNRHCGDDKAKQAAPFVSNEPTLIEPFLEGTSERILLVGDAVWNLDYESSDWRKNVGSVVRARTTPDRDLVSRARRTAQALGLRVVGVDYLVASSGPALLEINAYPGLTDAPGAEDAFLAEISAWWNRIEGSIAT
jgi:hypothetical protein